jgi:hypothetical protein
MRQGAEVSGEWLWVTWCGGTVAKRKSGHKAAFAKSDSLKNLLNYV